MTALRHLYTTGVLWLLSFIAKDAVRAIHDHAHETGANELRAFMRRELTAVQVGASTDRMRSYNLGFSDAMRLFDDEPVADAPIERVM